VGRLCIWSLSFNIPDLCCGIALVFYTSDFQKAFMVKVIPVTKAYREGYEKIVWEVVDRRDIEIPKSVEPCTKVYPAVGWVIK
jgi:hypothetical protein